MFDRVMAVMQDDLVMLALPAFFAALGIEWLWARKQFRPVYENQDFWASMRIMVLTVFVRFIAQTRRHFPDVCVLRPVTAKRYGRADRAVVDCAVLP